MHFRFINMQNIELNPNLKFLFSLLSGHYNIKNSYYKTSLIFYIVISCKTSFNLIT